jgi:voltage-gated potassium channel
LSFLSRKPLTAGRAARIIAFVTVSITVVSGVVIHFLDRANFPNIGGGMWWAVQTVTTVGYGDAVPTSTGGRLVAVLVMVLGIGFLTVVTAAITSTFVEAARGRMQAGGREPLEVSWIASTRVWTRSRRSSRR